MRRNRRSSADDVLEAAIDGVIIGAGIELMAAMFSTDEPQGFSGNNSVDTSDTTFGGGDFGGAGAGGEW